MCICTCACKCACTRIQSAASLQRSRNQSSIRFSLSKTGLRKRWSNIINILRENYFKLTFSSTIYLYPSIYFCLSVYLSTYTWEAVFQMYPVANCIFKNSPEQYFWSSILLQDLNIPHWEAETMPHDPERGKYISTVMIQRSRADSNIDYIKLLKCYRIKDTINKKQQIWKKYLKHI